MTKKRKQSRRDEAAEAEPTTPAANPGSTAASAPSVDRGVNRVSSPVEIAAALRDASSHPLPSRPEPQQTIDDYATVLTRRLAGMAPVVVDEHEAFQRDTRPLNERVRERQGVADLLMFRIGAELFAADLGAIEEAVELPHIHALPEMPAAMLGAFNLRGRLTPIYSPAHVIGVPLHGVAAAVLLVRAGGRRMGLAVDDVEDVMQVDLATVHDAPGTDDADGILLGVAHHGQALVSVIDAEALVAACLRGQELETT